MFIEVSCVPGNGSVRLTGNLGAVLKESAHIAIGWVRRLVTFHHHLIGSRAIDAGFLSKDQVELLRTSNIHIHCNATYSLFLISQFRRVPSVKMALPAALRSPQLSSRCYRDDVCVTTLLSPEKLLSWATFCL
jgi:hypothetical protein